MVIGGKRGGGMRVAKVRKKRVWEVAKRDVEDLKKKQKI